MKKFFVILEHKRCVATWLVFPSSKENVLKWGIKLLIPPFGFGTSPLSSDGLGSSQTIETLFCTLAHVKEK